MEVPEITLNNGQTIPQIGLGLWKIKDKQQCLDAVTAALKAGYRHLDTAQAYKNEAFVGEALQASGLPRKDVFITTKIWNDNQFWEELLPSLEQSLHNLQTDYVDLLLIHFPVTQSRTMAWRRLEQLYAEGRAKSIGVSNYTIKHLKELMKTFEIVPAVNQVELHVFLQQPELAEFCAEHGIVIEAYSPLAHAVRMDDPVVTKIAVKHDKSYAQIMLRCLVEKGFVILPKSIHQDRIQENLAVFDFALDKDDMRQLAACEANLRTCWDPTNIP